MVTGGEMGGRAFINMALDGELGVLLSGIPSGRAVLGLAPCGHVGRGRLVLGQVFLHMGLIAIRSKAHHVLRVRTYARHSALDCFYILLGRGIAAIARVSVPGVVTHVSGFI